MTMKIDGSERDSLNCLFLGLVPLFFGVIGLLEWKATKPTQISAAL